MGSNHIFRSIQTSYIDAQALLNFLQDYERPRDRIQRMVRSGELIRIKNGLYLIAEKIEGGPGGRAIPYEQLANILYGPSYVSLEWALSFYGIIPERVYTVTSMTLGRKKEYSTPVGEFQYIPLNKESYSIGVEQMESYNSFGNFLMASREKAVVDFVAKRCSGLTGKELETDLFESKRFNAQILSELNRDLLREISQSYRSKSVKHLVGIL